jgi:hypothetical protein
MRPLLALAIVVALVAVVAWQQATIRKLSVVAPAPVAAPPQVVWTQARVDEEALAARITDAVARRLQRPTETASAQPAAIVKEEASEKPMPAQLDRILSSGRTSASDLLALREQLRQANDPELAGEVVRQMAVAYNSGRLIPDDPRQIFP